MLRGLLKFDFQRKWERILDIDKTLDQGYTNNWRTFYGRHVADVFADAETRARLLSVEPRAAHAHALYLVLPLFGDLDVEEMPPIIQAC